MAVQVNSWKYSSVSSLFNCCIDSFVKVLTRREDWEFAKAIPAHIKDILFRVLSKRGALTDDTIGVMIHEDIQKIDLSECNISDEGLNRIATCKNLLEFSITSSSQPRTNITSTSLAKVFGSTPKLQIVHLRRCVAISDFALHQLATNCRNLKCLDISNCLQLSDDTLKILGKYCSFLESIDFSSTRMTDNGVESLVAGDCRSHLKEICMKKCVNLTDRAVESVTMNCCNVSILVFHGCPLITEVSRQLLERYMQEHPPMRQISWTIY